jgi:chromosome segregation ATPase
MAPSFSVLSSGVVAGGGNYFMESTKKTGAPMGSTNIVSNNHLYLESMSKDYKLTDNVEVQRLIKIISEQREEIESWRSKCNHLESHMSHFRGGENRVKELEGRVSILLAENQKMNSLINEKILEIEAWRSKYAKLEISITEFRGLEARNRDLESRINLLLNELEQWKQKYYDLEGERHHFERSKRSAAQDKDFFEAELKKLREVLDVRSKECEEW